MNVIGQRGEELAATFIEKMGYLVLAKNWRCERGELDLVAKDGVTLVFIEVKTRRSTRFGSPSEAVDVRKQEKLRLLARHYIYQTHTTSSVYRFDVISVDGKTDVVTHIKDAF